jgi:hypothetical protein
MKVGDIVKFVHPPGMGVTLDKRNWPQQGAGLIRAIEKTQTQDIYNVLWRNGNTTNEWKCYIEVISKA